MTEKRGRQSGAGQGRLPRFPADRGIGLAVERTFLVWR